MTQKNKKEKEGFTLVETLVAIAVLLLAVTAPLSLATKSLNSSALSKQQITASFLAQEAMEYIRNARDENVLVSGSNNWLNGTGATNIVSCLNKKCQVDVVYQTMTNCPGDVCSPLLYEEATGLYNTQSGTASPYTRVVEIADVINDREIAILIKVSWQGPSGINYSVIARENLTNWQY